jgi:hypothetical protein
VDPAVLDCWYLLGASAGLSEEECADLRDRVEEMVLRTYRELVGELPLP